MRWPVLRNPKLGGCGLQKETVLLPPSRKEGSARSLRWAGHCLEKGGQGWGGGVDRPACESSGSRRTETVRPVTIQPPWVEHSLNNPENPKGGTGWVWSGGQILGKERNGGVG